MFGILIFFIYFCIKNNNILTIKKVFVMDGISLLSLDMIQKEDFMSCVGARSASLVCGCICIGPVSPGLPNIDNMVSSDSDCSDCGAANAHRVSN